MSRTSALYELQQVDLGAWTAAWLGCGRSTSGWATVKSSLLPAPVRGDCGAAGAGAGDAQDACRTNPRKPGTRLRGLDRKMYDGSVKNPKELGQMQEEAAHLRVRVKTLEDSALDMMMTSRRPRTWRPRRGSTLKGLQQEQELFHSGLIEEKEKLLGQAKVLQVKRQRSVGELPWADLQLYERMRRSKGGLAVVEVRNSICLRLPFVDSGECYEAGAQPDGPCYMSDLWAHYLSAGRSEVRRVRP